MIRKIYKKFTYLFILHDVFLIFCTIFMAPMVRYFDRTIIFYHKTDYQIYILIVIYLLVFFIMDLNNISANFSVNRFIVTYILSFVLISIAVASLFFMFYDQRFGRGVWIIQIALAAIALLPLRIFLILYVRGRMQKKRFVLIGINNKIEYAYKIISSNPYAECFGILRYNDDVDDSSLGDKLIGTVNELDSIILNNNIEGLILSDKQKISRELETSILKWKMKGVQIYDVPSAVEMFAEKVPIEFINDYWIIFNTFFGLNNNIYNKTLKRMMDIILSIFGLIFALPVMIFSAIIVKLESKGPVFYKQIRVGLNEKDFKILKFRSMRTDAEKNGAVWASTNDDRTTLFGKFIRKVRIDELPQLINVLKGEMSLIGPRPERPEFVVMLKNEIPYYSLRHMIKPGVTGWAQINYPYGASIEEAMEKLKYDLYYMRHLTMKLDIIILLKTVRTILLRQGSR